MLNSRNYVSDEQVLQIGEVIESEYDGTTPGLKVYYHQTKGAQTHMPDGAAIKFLGGMFATSNEEIKAYLDKIADKPGTQIYTKQETRQKEIQSRADLAEESAGPTGNTFATTGQVQASQEILQQTQQNLSTSAQPNTPDEVVQVQKVFAAPTQTAQVKK